MKSLLMAILAAFWVLAGCGSEAPGSFEPLGGPVGPSSESFGESAGPAALEIRVTDAPLRKVTKIEITVTNVEVNQAQGPSQSGWHTVVSEPQTFDLVQLTGIEAVLGKASLEPGRYNQIRLEVLAANVSTHDESMPAIVPSGKLRLAGSFELTSGEITVVTLDFDAEKSVVFRGKMDPLLKPVVRLLVRKEGQSLSEAIAADAPE